MQCIQYVYVVRHSISVYHTTDEHMWCTLYWTGLYCSPLHEVEAWAAMEYGSAPHLRCAASAMRRKKAWVQTMLERADGATGRTALHWCCRCPQSESACILAKRIIELHPPTVLARTRHFAVVHRAHYGDTSGPGLLVLYSKSTSTCLGPLQYTHTRRSTTHDTTWNMTSSCKEHELFRM